MKISSPTIVVLGLIASIGSFGSAFAEPTRQDAAVVSVDQALRVSSPVVEGRQAVAATAPISVGERYVVERNVPHH